MTRSDAGAIAQLTTQLGYDLREADAADRLSRVLLRDDQQFFVADMDGHVELSMESLDGSVSVKVIGDEVDTLPASCCFSSLAEASAFFEGGSLGYSVTRDSTRLDGLLLRTLDWRVRALSLSYVHSSFFSDRLRFGPDSIQFDHALIMRDLVHEWHQADDMYSLSAVPALA